MLTTHQVSYCTRLTHRFPRHFTGPLLRSNQCLYESPTHFKHTTRGSWLHLFIGTEETTTTYSLVPRISLDGTLLIVGVTLLYRYRRDYFTCECEYSTRSARIQCGYTTARILSSCTHHWLGRTIATQHLCTNHLSW